MTQIGNYLDQKTTDSIYLEDYQVIEIKIKMRMISLTMFNYNFQAQLGCLPIQH